MKYVGKSNIEPRTTYKPGANYCGLCNLEKVAILLSDPQTTLKLLEMCRHQQLESLKK